ncbi:MAG: phosphoglucomutase/phosphomannomutase PgmG [Magnetospiraceae bacterium]
MSSHPHPLHPEILREYDIRGIVGDSLTVADVTAIGSAFGTIARGKGAATVAVGYDGRLSSPGLADALAEGLASTGMNVIRIGVGPTPMLYFATYHLPADAGIMITGSHNPPDYNGLKMMLKGKPFFADAIQDLGRIAAAGDFATGEGQITETDIFGDYIDRLVQDFKPGGKALSVVWDAGNGAAGPAMAALAAKLPGTHHLLFKEIDGNFPNHHPDPTVEKNLIQLKEAVAAKGCDLGIAFDGDGDRIGVIDGQGRVLWGDQFLVALAQDVIATQPGATIIADVKASQTLFDEISRMGGTPLMFKTGHSLIKTKMAETGAPLAGEMSGHVFFADKYHGYDDALYAAVRLLSVLAHSDRSLADWRDALPAMVNTPELRIDCAEDKKFAAIQTVKDRLAGGADGEVITVDGVRVVTPDGWWLLRASNTQAVLVARAEAAHREGLDRLLATLENHLNAAGITEMPWHNKGA